MDLLKFDVTIDNKVTKIDIDKDLDINMDDLNNELIKQPSKYAYYATLSEYAHKRVAELENEINVTYSQIYNQIVTANNQLEAEESKKDKPKKVEKLTETAIKNMIVNRKAYNELVKQQIEMEYIYNILKSTKNAFEQRCQMLIQLGSISRTEMNNAVISIKEKIAEKAGKR